MNCTPLLTKEAFAPLASDASYRGVRVDTAGYGIIWNDEIDLAESEPWINGEDIQETPSSAK